MGLNMRIYQNPMVKICKNHHFPHGDVPKPGEKTPMFHVFPQHSGIYMDTDFVPDRPFADYGDLFRWPFVTHKVLDVPLFVEIGGVILKNLGYHPDCRIYLHV